MVNASTLFFTKNQPIFMLGASKEVDLPPNDLTEFIFIGRSNVGKSSLINSITNSKIALVSKTPGRTKQLNFFQVANKIAIVDAPGYGYAKANKKEVENWNDLIFKYLLKRKNLKRVFLLIDSRHGIKENDEQMMLILDNSGILYQIILTKIDEIKDTDLNLRIKEIEKVFKEHTALFGETLFASSRSGVGIEQIRDTIYSLT
ncbi:MAG: ribosome biogenesis GTP-binding protein YihA/YsxC [Rickettsiales bacterium]|jgi:GTP-binding protein|nr:ribosome biogenesis GTP-binding protein YihA/YsxC [Rickettsiales bacterium]